MVRKRSRKYESDDNDSDSDLEFDTIEGEEPAPKKYSLRERKRAPLFTTDYYYGLDDDDEPKKHSSDDEDFEVEADVGADGEATRSYFEPESGPQNSEGLIDFEDIIRADIVVNKNKIDYDNLIQKTEIKLTQPVKKRRGRKPKSELQPKEELADPDYTCEPDINALTKLENQNDGENKEAEQAEINFCEGQGGLAAELNHLENGDSVETSDASKVVNETDPLAMKNANNIETVLVNPPPIEENVVKDETKTVEDDDDDVIVLGEIKQDVIVLDD